VAGSAGDQAQPVRQEVVAADTVVFAPEAAWQARDQACPLARCLAAMKALCGT
jgi:hypothetical protein